MKRIHIDHVVVRAPGISGDTAETLAREVSSALRQLAAESGSTVSPKISRAHVRVTADWDERTGVRANAQYIARQIWRGVR